MIGRTVDQRRRLTLEARCGPLGFGDEKALPNLQGVGQTHKVGISALGSVGSHDSAKRAKRFLPPSCPSLHLVQTVLSPAWCRCIAEKVRNPREGERGAMLNREFNHVVGAFLPILLLIIVLNSECSFRQDRSPDPARLALSLPVSPAT